MERETKVNKECEIGIGRTTQMLAHQTAQMGVDFSYQTSSLALFSDAGPFALRPEPTGMVAATVAFEMV